MYWSRLRRMASVCGLLALTIPLRTVQARVRSSSAAVDLSMPSEGVRVATSPLVAAGHRTKCTASAKRVAMQDQTACDLAWISVWFAQAAVYYAGDAMGPSVRQLEVCTARPEYAADHSFCAEPQHDYDVAYNHLVDTEYFLILAYWNLAMVCDNSGGQ
jgi:hypothetical protein